MCLFVVPSVCLSVCLSSYLYVCLIVPVCPCFGEYRTDSVTTPPIPPCRGPAGAVAYLSTLFIPLKASLSLTLNFLPSVCDLKSACVTLKTFNLTALSLFLSLLSSFDNLVFRQVSVSAVAVCLIHSVSVSS